MPDTNTNLEIEVAEVEEASEATEKNYVTASDMVLNEVQAKQPVAIQRILRSALLLNQKNEQLQERFQRQVTKLYGEGIDVTQLWNDLMG